jgi:hypothetical protein
MLRNDASTLGGKAEAAAEPGESLTTAGIIGLGRGAARGLAGRRCARFRTRAAYPRRWLLSTLFAIGGKA